MLRDSIKAETSLSDQSGAIVKAEEEVDELASTAAAVAGGGGGEVTGEVGSEEMVTITEDMSDLIILDED
jgi:hypothetical protein